jgi:hypothetical protein
MSQGPVPGGVPEEVLLDVVELDEVVLELPVELVLELLELLVEVVVELLVEVVVELLVEAVVELLVEVVLELPLAVPLESPPAPPEPPVGLLLEPAHPTAARPSISDERTFHRKIMLFIPSPDRSRGCPSRRFRRDMRGSSRRARDPQHHDAVHPSGSSADRDARWLRHRRSLGE